MRSRNGLELARTLDAERQRGEIRTWICKDSVDQHSDARHVRRLLGELSDEDLLRPFGERTFGDLALERGRLHFLGAYLDAGGVAPQKEGGPPLALGPKGRLASPRRVARCRMLADDWRRYEAAARRSLRPGSHPTDLSTYLAKGIVGVRGAAVARRRRLLAYIEWLRRRAAGGTLLFKGPAVNGVALKSAEPVEGHERARLLLGDAAQESPDSPRATNPRERVMQMPRSGDRGAELRPYHRQSLMRSLRAAWAGLWPQTSRLLWFQRSRSRPTTTTTSSAASAFQSLRIRCTLHACTYFAEPACRRR